MRTRLNPYLAFEDKARQAREFYKGVFGGKLTMQTFKEANASRDPSDDGKIMHAQLEADNDMVLMASDTPKGMPYRGGASNVSISLSGDDDRQLSGYFEKLAAGGKVTMPLEKAPWGDKFGMLTDKFGIEWMVNIAGKRT